MLTGFIAAMKGVIDLRKKAREDKKTGLEIEKLEAERKIRDSLIRIATLEDIHKYDPKVRSIDTHSHYILLPKPKPRRSLLVLLLLISGLFLLAYLLHRWLPHIVDWSS